MMTTISFITIADADSICRSYLSGYEYSPGSGSHNLPYPKGKPSYLPDCYKEKDKTENDDTDLRGQSSPCKLYQRFSLILRLMRITLLPETVHLAGIVV